MKSVPPFPNVVCWDAASRPRVANTIALDVLPAVFQATHSPSPLRRVGAAGGAVVAETEDHFLIDFLDPARDHVLNLAVGDSGSGKSHLIRWMYFEMARLNTERGAKWHVVLVPRSSANLHEVVAQVLRGFEGPVVQAVQRELALARGKLTRSAARHRVLDELAFVLGDENTAQRPGSRKLSEDESEIRRLLPDFLRDGAIRAWLIRSADVVARLGDHVAGAREIVAADPDQLRWRDTQLDVPPDVFKKTGSNAEELAGLLMNDAAIRRSTARLLNEAWADVSGALLGLQRGNLGGALIEMRKELLAQGREMVLLIEDMSVTQGVDEELLEALILRPHERPGEPLCPLRSVVGMTPEDADSLRDNIRGRLHRTVQLTVPLSDTAGEGQVGPDRLALFAARYLNAARYSVEELEAWYRDPLKSRQPLPSFCSASGCPNVAQCHGAFGAVAPDAQTGGYGLYPFTPDALLRLYDQADRPGTAPVARTFNPRRLVGRVLNTVLEAAEQTIPTGQFPPAELLAEFRLANVPADVKVKIEEKHPADAARLRWALELYGPSRPELPFDIAEAFALPAIRDKETRRQADKETRRPGDKEKAAPVAPQGVAVAAAAAGDVFDRWSNGERLEDRELNRWRGWVYDAVCAEIDWDTERGFAALAALFRRNYIHFEGQFVNAETGDVRLFTPRSAQAALALRALARLHTGQLAPADAEAQLEIALPWVERWADEVRRQMHERFAAVTAGSPDARALAAVLLAAGAVIRGGADFPSDEAGLLAAAFTDWPETAGPDHRTAAWGHLLKLFQDQSGGVRAWLQQFLTCPKGANADAGVLDPSPVLPALRAFAETGELPPLPAEAKRWPDDGPRDLAAAVARHLPQAVAQELTACRNWLAEVETRLGGQEPADLLRALPGALEFAAESGVLPAGRTAEELGDRIRLLSRRPLKECLDFVRNLAATTDRRAQLTGLAKRDAELMDDFAEVLRDAGQVLGKALAQAQGQADRLARGADAAALDAARTETIAALANLKTAMTVLLTDVESTRAATGVAASQLGNQPSHTG